MCEFVCRNEVDFTEIIKFNANKDKSKLNFNFL